MDGFCFERLIVERWSLKFLTFFKLPIARVETFSLYLPPKHGDCSSAG